MKRKKDRARSWTAKQTADVNIPVNKHHGVMEAAGTF
jgi:hypothetical protein